MNSNSKGFALIEIMFGVGIVAVSALGLANWLEILGRQYSANLQNEGALAIAESVTTALGNDTTHCSPNLANVPASGSALPAIKAYDDLGALQSEIVTTGVQVAFAGLNVSDLSILPLIPIDARSLVGDLRLSNTKTGVSGPIQVIRHIPVSLTVNSGQIGTCETTPIPSDVMRDRICEIWNDGFSHYDPTVGDCVDNPGVKWFAGTGTSVSCGPGYRFAAYPADPNANNLVCQTLGAPAGRSLVRSYLDGTVLANPVNMSLNALDTTTNTCMFSFPNWTAATGTISSIPVSIKCVAM
jgi:hypothetical protein